MTRELKRAVQACSKLTGMPEKPCNRLLLDVIRGHGTSPVLNPRRPLNSYAIITGLVCGACGWSMRHLKTTGGVKVGCDNVDCYLNGTLFEEPSVTLVPSAVVNILSGS